MQSILFSIIYLLPIYAFVVYDDASPNIHSESSLIARFDPPPPSGRRTRPVGMYGGTYQEPPPVLYPGANHLPTYDSASYPQPYYATVDTSLNYDRRNPPRGQSGSYSDGRGGTSTYLSDSYTPARAAGYGGLSDSHAPLGSNNPLTFTSPRPATENRDRLESTLNAYDAQDLAYMSDYARTSPWDRLDNTMYNIAPSDAAYYNAQRAASEDPEEEENVSPITTTFYDNRGPRQESLGGSHGTLRPERGRVVVQTTDGRQATPGHGRPRVVEISPRNRRRDLPRSSHYSSGDRKVRRMTLDGLAGDTKGTAPQSQNALAQYQIYEAAYASVQSNISEIIFPYLDEILAGTNASLAYDMALSIWAELTAAPVFVTTPFSYGQNCLDWMEEAYINQTNANATAAHSTLHANGTYANGTYDFALLEFQATSRVLLELYEYAWYNASAAANKTGLLKELAVLGGYLLPVNASIASPRFLNPVNTTMESLSYFTVYNETMNDNATIPGLGY